jgi:hypothetical protein
MSVDLGDLAGLATALGLVDDGDLVPDWFARPGDYLSSVLREPGQREALVAFVDEMLGGDEAGTDDQGRQWLPLITVGAGRFTACAVIQPEAGRVVVGVGLRVAVTSASGVGCDVEAVVPLFAQPTSGPTTVVPGSVGAYVDLSLDLTFPPGTSRAEVSLAGVALDVGVPTWAGGEPRFGLVLRGLRLPGAATATDVAITADALDELDDALVGLVLGLLRAQAAALGPDEPLTGLATLLGLGQDAVPDFPLDDVLGRGTAALADWLAVTLGDDTTRAAWLGGLATLTGGSLVGAGAAAQVELDLAPATLRLAVQVSSGVGARPVLTPTLTLDVVRADGVLLALDAEAVRLDLGTGTAVAVPRLSLTARLSGTGGAPLLTPAGAGLTRVGVRELRAGFGIDPARRPVLVVEAHDADVGETHFDLLDLTSPDALAAAAGQVVTDAAASLLDGLGAAGDAVGLVLGIPRPAAPALPTVDAARLLSDPLGAVAERWRVLLAGAADDVRTVLEALRDLIADTAAQALPVTGGGTSADPWRVPVTEGVALTVWSADDVLSVAVAATIGVEDLGGSGYAMALSVEATLVELGLGDGAGVPRHAAFLPAASGRLVVTATGGGPLAIGTPPTSLTADELGLAAVWAPATGVRVQPVAAGAHLLLGGEASLDLPVPVVGSDGQLTLDDAGWAALETLVGAAAEAIVVDDLDGALAWVADAVRMVGWSPGLGSGPRGAGSAAGPRLSLAALVSDPATELEAYLRALLDVGSDTSALQGLLDLLARLVGPLAGRIGGGTAHDPWRLPLLGATLDALGDAVPALTAWLGPDGPSPTVVPYATPLFGWQPGDTPLDAATLVAGLVAQSVQDEVLADLVAGRGDLVAGLEELVVRWTGTDGLVGFVESELPAGVTGHRLSDIDHATPLAGIDLTVVVGALPATVVHVAIDGTDVLPAAADDHTVDLTPPGLAPEAFALTVPADPTGAWAVRLGRRAACRTTGSTDDPDGVLGQAGRLTTVLRPLAAAGPVLVVAHGGAGQPAVRAASALAAEGTAIDAVVTVATPWTTLSVDTLDRLPGADALRLLAALLPAGPTEDDPDDEDLGLGRRMLGVWQQLDTLGDPLAELRPPATPTPTAGVRVHACVGALGEETVRRAITATVVTGLVERAWARADTGVAAPELTRFGARWPLLAPTARAGLTTSLTLDLDLAGAAGTPDGAAPAGPVVVVRFALGGADGNWLLGGPDPGRAPGADRPLGLRRLTAQIDLPLDGAAATARVDLHDALALGVRRSRWTLAAGPSAPVDATPALPEVRALLGATIARLTAAAGADPVLAAVLDALGAIGLVGDDGGLDAVTLDRVLLDPSGVVATVGSDALRRSALAGALRTLAGDLRDAATASEQASWTLAAGAVTATATVDLGARTVRVSAAGTGAIDWAVTAALVAGTASLSLRLGPDLPDPPGPAGLPGAAVPGVALLLDLTPSAATALSARLRVARPGTPATVQDVPLWPGPDPAAIGRTLADLAPAALTRTLLDVLRQALADAAPAAGRALDTLLDVLGLLAAAPAIDPALPPEEIPLRRLRLPVGLIAGPAAWLRGLPVASGPAGLAAVLPPALDAIRDLLGAAGTAGRVEIADGVAISATNDGGTLRLAVDVEAGAFAGAGAADRLVLTGRLGLAVTGSGGGQPDVAIAGALAGAGGVALGVAGGTGAAQVTLDLLPDGGVAIPILPAGPGLGGAVADAAVGAAVHALPHLLDAVADLDPAGAPSTPGELAGRLVVRVGDALGLRSGAPLGFDADALSAFGTDPAGALAARTAALAGAGLDMLVQAVDPVLGPAATRSVTAVGGALVVTMGAPSGQVEVRWTPGTSTVRVSVSASGLPGVEDLLATVEVAPAGLVSLDVSLGPAELDAGVVVLRPFARVRAGQSPPGGRAVEVGLGVGADRLLLGRFALDGAGFTLLTRTGTASPVESTAPADVVLAVVEAVLDLAGAFVLAVPEVAAALDAPLLGTTARDLLAGVLLDAADTSRLDAGLLEADGLLARLGTLLSHLAAAPGAEVVVDDALTLRPHAEPATGGGTTYGLTLVLARPFDLGGTDVTASLEQLSSWIDAPSGPVPGGLTLDVLTVRANGSITLRPALVVGGMGLRLGRASGPLLDAGITVDEVAVHLYADVAPGGGGIEASGGVRLELGGLTVGLAGASGGDNAVANSLMGSGSESPAPRFSPAIAVQKHGDGEVRVSLSAGDGVGPWWVVVQKGFGPIYVEQVGLQVTMSQSALASVGLLIDGQVSLLGLTASVDDLSLTYLVSTDPARSPLSPQAWAVDLAGLAVTADVGGIVLAGGLRKFPADGGGTEYLGLLMARFAVYGISVYGGYGLVGPPGDQYASLFLFGAVNGPIGGPPAFFITGIGGGFGINRALTYPSDLSQFGTYPFIKALDPAARPGDPMDELEQVRQFFPAERGTFWFAAGLSFTSFALVDGVAVVAVQIGDGFELALLGLARMALPRPEAALVSVELGLLARVSASEDLILVQAQLTDNSWLLFPTVRLTGGFAFASWFGGPNSGQFVLTLGGYHPSFHRDGYPVVPRLGIAVDLYGFISITGESYFALTSEALMAGAKIEVSADLGPAWAHLVLGCDGIVFFDPFWFEVTVYASISAGVTIDVWIGEITISVSLSARVTVTGPPFHARATFSVGPVDLEVEFGDAGHEPTAIDWPTFIGKYLETASTGTAAVLNAVTGKGGVPPAGDGATGGARSPDGSDANPFRVVPEFELTVTSTAPVRELTVAGTTQNLTTVPEVSAAPMRADARPRITLTFVGPEHDTPIDRADKLTIDALKQGWFAIGTWGPAQDLDDKAVPAGDVLNAVDRLLIRTTVAIAPGTGPIEYRQVEIDPYKRRRPLPFVTEGAPERRRQLRRGSQRLAETIPPLDGRTTLEVAADLLATRAGRSPSDVAAWAGSRAAPPLLGSLGEGLGRASRNAAVTAVAPQPPQLPPLRPPAVAAVLTAPVPDVVAEQLTVGGDGRPVGEATRVGAHTTVSPELRDQMDELIRSAVPRLADVDARMVAAVPARLLRVAPVAGVVAPYGPGGPGAAHVPATVLPTRVVPPTRSGRSGGEAVADRGASSASLARLRTGGESLPDGMRVPAGEVHVLSLPDADRDVDPDRRPRLLVRRGAVRVVAIGPGGRVKLDTRLDVEQGLAVPPGTRRLAVVALGERGGQGAGQDGSGLGVAGWASDTPLPYLGGEAFLAADAVVSSGGRVPSRRDAQVRLGWVAPDVVIGGASAVLTRFAGPADLVAVAMEGGAGDDLALGLDGARRAVGPDGDPAPPLLVADGPRAVAVFAVTPLLVERRPRPLVVTVASGPTRRLVGVAAARGVEATVFGAAVADQGFPAVVPDPVPVTTADAVIVWKGQ